jgi:hypothetical protein
VIPAASARMSLRRSAISRSSSMDSSRLRRSAAYRSRFREGRCREADPGWTRSDYRMQVRLRQPLSRGHESAEKLSRCRCPRYPLRPRLEQHALYLCRRYSADIPRSAHGFPGSPDHPNRASEDDTSKVWPSAELCSQFSGLGRFAGPTAVPSRSAPPLPELSRIIHTCGCRGQTLG